MKLMTPKLLTPLQGPVWVTKPEVSVAGGPEMVHIKPSGPGHYVYFHYGFFAHAKMEEIGGRLVGQHGYGFYYFAGGSVEEILELIELAWS